LPDAATRFADGTLALLPCRHAAADAYAMPLR